MKFLDKKVLVTGADGQLGSALVHSSTHFDFIAMNRRKMDIADKKIVHHELDALQPSSIVNCAAWTAVDLAEEQEAAAFKINAEGPGNLAQWCAVNESHLIHISTDYVFNGKKPLFEAYTENDAVDPVSVYGKTKRMGEDFVKGSDANFSILRTAWLYGASGKNFLKTMLRLILADPSRAYKVVADQYGSPTSADALSRQIITVIDNPVYGTMHASSHGYCSWYEFACEFFSLLGIDHCLRPCSTAEYPTPAVRPQNSILENTVLKEHGLDNFNDWRDDLAIFVESYGKDLLAEAQSSLESAL